MSSKKKSPKQKTASTKNRDGVINIKMAPVPFGPPLKIEIK